MSKLLPILTTLLFSMGLPTFATAASEREGADQKTPGQTTIEQLCANGIEGSYRGTLGKKIYRFNLLCIEGNRLVTSLGEESDYTGVMLSLGEAAIDGTTLVLSTFKIAHDERRDISARNTLVYLRFNLAQLRNNRLEGYFHAQNLNHFAPVSAKRVQTFPTFACDSRHAFPADEFAGAYQVHGTTFGEVTLLADVLAGTPVMTLLVPDLEGRNAMDGPTWDRSGCFTSHTAQGDWEPESRQLIFFRGQYLGNGKLKIYWVTYRGLEGPYLAIKKQTPASLL